MTNQHAILPTLVRCVCVVPQLVLVFVAITTKWSVAAALIGETEAAAGGIGLAFRIGQRVGLSYFTLVGTGRCDICRCLCRNRSRCTSSGGFEER